MNLDTFTRQYIETALWSSTDEEGKPLDDYGTHFLDPDTRDRMIADCADFQASFGEYFIGKEGEAGHDFWLTRNGHGAGFWDGDWKEPMPEGNGLTNHHTVGDYLTAMSKPYGSFDLYVGDDGKIYGN